MDLVRELFVRAMIKTLGSVTVVNLQGYISFESTEPFRKVCREHLLEKEVIFDFSGLSFVGSCGIQDFLGVLREHREAAVTPARFSAVGPEFRRLLGIANLDGTEIYPSEEMAILRVHADVVPLWVDVDLSSEDEGLLEVGAELAGDIPGEGNESLVEPVLEESLADVSDGAATGASEGIVVARGTDRSKVVF